MLKQRNFKIWKNEVTKNSENEKVVIRDISGLIQEVTIFAISWKVVLKDSTPQLGHQYRGTGSILSYRTKTSKLTKQLKKN